MFHINSPLIWHKTNPEGKIFMYDESDLCSLQYRLKYCLGWFKNAQEDFDTLYRVLT